MRSTNAKSRARRIANLEVMLELRSEPIDWRSRRWRSGKASPVVFELQFGHLCRLAADYAGERHIVVKNILPDRNGQKWAEFAEVSGPAPILPPQDADLRRCVNIIFVAPYPRS